MRFNAVACTLAVLALTPNASAQDTYGQQRALSLYNQLVDPGACESALPVAREFWPTSSFSGELTIEDQEYFLAAVIQCASSLEDGRAAIDAANAAHDLGVPWADKVRLQFALSFDDDALAVDAFFDLAQSAHKEFQTLESYNAWGALRAAERLPNSGETLLRMHELLAAANYRPQEGFHDDYFRLDHARQLLARGRVEDARRRLEGVVDPQVIMTLRINRIYDPLRSDAAFERRLDIAAAGEASIERARQAVTDRPRRLALVIQYAASLRDFGRSEEALAVLEPVAALATSANGPEHFDDLADQLNWLLFAKADVLNDLGRNREAHTVYSEAMTAGEVGQGNITILFAGMLNAEGRGADALQVLEMLGRLTEYADVWMQSERACAAELVGNTAIRDEALIMLRANEADNARSLMHALLCVNDIDGAAALMIRRLNNPIEREAALVALQPYRRIATRHMPAEVVQLDRLAQVRNRPDVQAAIEAVGRIEPTPLYSY